MWKSAALVGEQRSSFGVSSCEMSRFTGTVAHIRHNDIPITHVSGGGGSVVGFNGYVSGYTAPVRSSTEIKTDFKVWIRSDEGKDFSISRDWALDVAVGQKVTLLFVNDELVAYVNHNTDSWYYMKADEDIARITKQAGYLLENGEQIKSSEERRKDGTSSGALCAAIAFFTTVAVQWCDFWGWQWLEKPSSPWWYFLPAFFMLGGLAQFGKKAEFWAGLLLTSAIGFGSLAMDLERWGGIAVVVILFSLCRKPSERYQYYINYDAVEQVKKIIHKNANYALRHF